METFNRSPRMLSPKIPPTSSEGLRPETSPSGARFSAFHPFFVWKTESLGRNHEDTRFERYTPRKTNGCNPEIKVWFQMMFPLHFAENFYRVSCSFVFFPGSTFSCWWNVRSPSVKILPHPSTFSLTIRSATKNIEKRQQKVHPSSYQSSFILWPEFIQPNVDDTENAKFHHTTKSTRPVPQQQLTCGGFLVARNSLWWFQHLFLTPPPLNFFRNVEKLTRWFCNSKMLAIYFSWNSRGGGAVLVLPTLQVQIGFQHY